jgi:dethiobiotin synthetase
MSHPGVFITGTDTDVGKTFAASILLELSRARGIRWGVMKPVETGVDEELGPCDAQRLRSAALSRDPLEEICPQQFAMPAAPTVAAAAENSHVDLEAIDRAWQSLKEKHPLLLVEGAGGLRVPLDEKLDMGDLALRFELPLLLIIRGKLGTMNHTRLSLDEAHRRGIPVAGVIINHVDGPLSAADEANLASLRSELGSQLLGELPFFDDGAPPGEALAPYLDLESLLSRIR